MPDWKKIFTLGGIVATGGSLGYLAFKPKTAKAALPKSPTPSTTSPVAAATLAASAAATGSGFAGFPKAATVNTSSTPLNIRATPNANGAEVGKAPKGAQISVTGPTVSGDNSQNPQGWAPVQFGSVVGFASAKFLA